MNISLFSYFWKEGERNHTINSQFFGSTKDFLEFLNFFVSDQFIIFTWYFVISGELKVASNFILIIFTNNLSDQKFFRIFSRFFFWFICLLTENPILSQFFCINIFAFRISILLLSINIFIISRYQLTFIFSQFLFTQIFLSLLPINQNFLNEISDFYLFLRYYQFNLQSAFLGGSLLFSAVFSRLFQFPGCTYSITFQAIHVLRSARNFFYVRSHWNLSTIWDVCSREHWDMSCKKFMLRETKRSRETWAVAQLLFHAFMLLSSLLMHHAAISWNAQNQWIKSLNIYI